MHLHYNRKWRKGQYLQGLAAYIFSLKQTLFKIISKGENEADKITMIIIYPQG